MLSARCQRSFVFVVFHVSCSTLGIQLFVFSVLRLILNGILCMSCVVCRVLCVVLCIVCCVVLRVVLCCVVLCRVLPCVCMSFVSFACCALRLVRNALCLMITD